MLCVETIGKIRRRRLVQGDSISAIARDLGLARNTVKRALRFEGEAYEYRRKRQPVPKLGPYLATLDGWLELEEKLPARERRTAQRMFEGLRLEGYIGAVDAVRRHIREWERRRHPIATAFIPQSFAPGEAYQFDWSHEHVELGGLDQVVKVAHVRLCHSRARPGVCLLRRGAPPRDLRQLKTGGGCDLRRPRASLQPSVPGDVQPLSDRADSLHAGGRLGEGAG